MHELLQHPRLRLDLTLSDRLVDPVEEGYDLVVRITRLPDSSLISRRLSSTRMVLCASPAYLARHGAPEHPSRLSANAVWSYRYFGQGEQWRFDAPDEEPVRVRVHPVVRTNNGDTCRAGALNGQCIVLQPTFLVGPDLQAGRLVELMPQWQAGELGIYALYASRRHLPSRVRLMIDYLAGALREPHWAV